MPTVLFLVLLAAAGLAVGSFLNVLIVRVPVHQPILRSRSRCPQCQAPIAARDNIPVLSWVLLRGRCRTCRQAIPGGYPLVELANAALWVVAGLRFGVTLAAVAFAVFFSVLLALSVIDLELSILPDKITLPSVLASLVILPVLSLTATDHPVSRMLGAVVGGVAYAGFLFVTLIAFELIVKKEGMGFGDVKLAAVLGLWLGWLSPLLILFALIAASVLGLAAGVGYFAVRRTSTPFPFGPWLAVGTIVVIVLSRSILDVYAP